MSFPDKQQRKICWDSRDRYWECLDDQNIKDSSEKPKACAELRRIFEKSCPPKHQQQKIMDLLDESLLKLSSDTADIRSKDIQALLIAMKKTSVNKEYCDKILEKLCMHLETGFQEFDDQLLCSTCFYILLNKSDYQEFYLRNVLKVMHYELEVKENIFEKSRISLAISLCYGMFQSTYLLQQQENFNITMVQTIEAIFNLLIQKAYEYTQYTFIAFKIMTSFKKVVGTKFQDILFNKNNQVKLLNLINHNWENPIAGVRNLNKIVFQNLLLVLDQDIYESVFKEINFFYWNKAKFLMLAEIIEQSKTDIKSLVSENQWLDGLVYSLSRPGLVSAGADMYSAVLKKINSEETWTSIFLVKIIDVLGGTCFKTIENFTNYWCLNTLKKIPSVLQLLINELNNINYTAYKLYSIICIIKQGTKLGISRENLPSCYNELKMNDNYVLFLEHCNTSVRMLAFENICISQPNLLPRESDYKLILKYLSDNVNSDCTVLRISMINNLKIFLDKLHAIFLNTIPKDSNDDIQNMLFFCQNLQIFIIESITLNGNYQRKITSVQITQTILKSFIELKPRKKHQVKEINMSLIGFLKEKGYWNLNDKSLIMKLIDLLKDPACDVHECVLQLLSEFYTSELSDASIINYLIEQALKYISSKFFYEISCGQIMFKLVINILLKTKNMETKFKSVEDIFYYAFSEINIEYATKTNVVKSIQDGKQLHSFLSILSIIFESLIKNSLQIRIAKDTIFSLLNIVDFISNQFAWEEDLSTSSDFSKMSDMVQIIIRESGLKTENDDHTRISDLHQIVLNCLWLNVKASCELASLMIQYYKHDKDICEKCLNIITRVLETSRHKGAIEAAGTVLGAGIQCLTSQSEDREVSQLPFTLLKNKLNELLFETSKMSSVTRRGAGLSIMVHRIVSNDHKKGKPLFHYFMKTLLDVCKNLDNTQNKEEPLETSNEKDLPKAIYIHFLTRIVTDSSLASDTMYYTVELAELAFNNLINDHWQIRNAALQLYGALIPKLIGQKKASGIDEETVATVACDEFRSHSPKLWEYIIKQIKEQGYEDILQAHSNLVPILNVLASLAKRYNLTYDLKDQNDSDFNLLLHLLPLLGSPIYTVRRLTSQCIPNIYSDEQICRALENVQIVTQNYLHGILMLISNCQKIHSHCISLQLEKLSKKYQDTLKKTNQSYMCKWVLSSMCKRSENISIDSIKNILLEANRNKYEPGVSLWANTEIQNCLENMSWTLVPESLFLIMNTQEFDLYCDTLIKRIKDDMQPPENVLSEIVETLLSSQKTSNSSATWKIIYYISLKINIHDQTCNIKMIDAQIEHPSYKLRYVIPFATRFMVKQKNNNSLLLLSKTVYLLCNPESYDIDMRYIAALANNEFGYNLQSYSDEVKINAIKSAIVLLQDEDDDIRHLSVNFYKNLNNELKHPFICLNEILKHDFLCKVLNEPKSSIQTICKDLLNFIDQICTNKNNEYNPFSNDSKNIYLEKNLFRKTLQDLSKMCS